MTSQAIIRDFHGRGTSPHTHSPAELRCVSGCGAQAPFHDCPPFLGVISCAHGWGWCQRQALQQAGAGDRAPQCAPLSSTAGHVVGASQSKNNQTALESAFYEPNSLCVKQPLIQSHLYRLGKALQQSCEVSALIAPILQERKLRHGSLLACDHTIPALTSGLEAAARNTSSPITWQKGSRAWLGWGTFQNVFSVLMCFPSS